MAFVHTWLEKVKVKTAGKKEGSTFRENGELTRDEFHTAGNFLVNRFPTWSWCHAPESTQDEEIKYLVMRHVPCRQSSAEMRNTVTGGEKVETSGIDEGEGWLDTGSDSRKRPKGNDEQGEVRTLDGNGNMGEESLEGEEAIPDMEDDDDDPEALIRNPQTAQSSTITPRRTYDLYICYAKWYWTPQIFLSGHETTGQPLTFSKIKEDLETDYTSKHPVITTEPFPHPEEGKTLHMASVHPCKHGYVMKILMDKKEAAMRSKREASRAKSGASDAGDEWEYIAQHGSGQQEDSDEDELVIGVDQYLIFFIKLMASIMPSVEWDSTAAI
ncbi:MAG: E2-like enzyme [Chrysothrix sp. TS-e1954]|nr:MAG: E2-like enzyme [Chrysothrix sp. TS-e1954]